MAFPHSKPLEAFTPQAGDTGTVVVNDANCVPICVPCPPEEGGSGSGEGSGEGSGAGSGAGSGPAISTGCCVEAVPETLFVTWHVPGCAWDGVSMPLVYNAGLSSLNGSPTWVGNNPAGNDPCGTGAPSMEIQLQCRLIHVPFGADYFVWFLGVFNISGGCCPGGGGNADIGGYCAPFSQSFPSGFSMSGGPVLCDGTNGCVSGDSVSATVTA